MLCLSLFPTFTPSNFVRVIDSSVPCALAFWLCFVTPHLYQLAWFQLGGLSNLKKKKNKPKTSFLGCFVSRFPSAVSPQPGPPLRPCTGVSPTVLCAVHPRRPQATVGGRGQGWHTQARGWGQGQGFHPRLLLLWQVQLLHSFLVPHGRLFPSGSTKAQAESAGWEEQPCINKPFPYV